MRSILKSESSEHLRAPNETTKTFVPITQSSIRRRDNLHRKIPGIDTSKTAAWQGMIKHSLYEVRLSVPQNQSALIWLIEPRKHLTCPPDSMQQRSEETDAVN